jgi:cysteine desulfurase
LWAVADAPLYLDACATTPLAQVAHAAMETARQQAWANPSSLHGFGLAAAESLERSRHSLASSLGTSAEAVRFCSGATESVHLALLGAAATLPVGRLLISAVEHPAVNAAAARLQRQGWQVEAIPVSPTGLLDLDGLEQRLQPPTRLVSVIAAQSEVGAIQPLPQIAQLCRQAGVVCHTDAVQLAPHRPIAMDELGLDLVSLSAHKLGGPRGVGALLVRQGRRLEPLLGGGGQERGQRAGTEPVVLAAGFAAAVEAARDHQRDGTSQRIQESRDRLLRDVLALPGVTLSGPDPGRQPRLPHHISLMLSDRQGRPLDGRQLVRALWNQGVAVSSGSACSGGSGRAEPSPVLLAMGFDRASAASGLRLSLGSWLEATQLERVPLALERAMASCSAAAP